MSRAGQHSAMLSCNVTVHSSVTLSMTKKHRLFQYSIEAGHSEMYKRLSEDSHKFVIQCRLIKDFDFRTSKLVFVIS